MSGRSDHDSPAGVLLVSADRALIGEWHSRRVDEIECIDFEPTEAEEHELLGPSYSHPRGSGEKAAAARSSAQRDLWERRLEEHRERFARSAAAEAARAAKVRAWDVVLVHGDPRRTRPALDELQRRGVSAVGSDLVLDWLRPAALAERLAPEVEAARARGAGRGDQS
jgi:Bacterial archaeo-eukaryotic release factor family 10